MCARSARCAHERIRLEEAMETKDEEEGERQQEAWQTGKVLRQPDF